LKQRKGNEIYSSNRKALGMLGAAKEQDQIIFRTVLEDGTEASLLLYKAGTDQIPGRFP
jgi:hypothetical protein